MSSTSSIAEDVQSRRPLTVGGGSFSWSDRPAPVAPAPDASCPKPPSETQRNSCQIVISPRGEQVSIVTTTAAGDASCITANVHLADGTGVYGQVCNFWHPASQKGGPDPVKQRDAPPLSAEQLAQIVADSGLSLRL